MRKNNLRAAVAPDRKQGRTARKTRVPTLSWSKMRKEEEPGREHQKRKSARNSCIYRVNKERGPACKKTRWCSLVRSSAAAQNRQRRILPSERKPDALTY